MMVVSAISPLTYTGGIEPLAAGELTGLRPGRNLRRVPRLARLALGAALATSPEPNESGALVISTSYASVGSTFEFLNSIVDDGPDMASPTAFSHSVTNMVAALISQHLGLTGPCLTVTQDRFGPALTAAALLLDTGGAETVLLGAVGEHSELLSLMEDRARPVGRTSPDEGAVFFQLTRSTGPDTGATIVNNMDFKEFRAGGPLLQAGAMAQKLREGPFLRVTTEDGGEIDLHYRGQG